MKQTFHVSNDDTGRKIGKFLRAQIPEISFGKWAELFRKKEIRIDGQRAKKGEVLVAGQIITLFLEKEPQPKLKKQERRVEFWTALKKSSFYRDNFQIIFEGDFLVDK